MGFNPRDSHFKESNKTKYNNKDKDKFSSNKASDQRNPCKISNLWSSRGSCLVRNEHREIQWEKHNGSYRPTTLVKIAAFDMDSTLITTKSGAKFPKDQNDFILWDKEVPLRLKSLYNDGFDIVIFSNQLNSIERGIETQIQNKIDQIADAIGIPISAYISTHRDQNRKPQCGMWGELCRSLATSMPLSSADDAENSTNPYFVRNKLIDFPASNLVNMDESFYVGDAAGRPGIYKKNERGAPPEIIQAEDHSADDLNFACNVFVFDGTFVAGSSNFNKSGGVDSLTEKQQATLHKHFHVPEVFFKKQHQLNYWTPSATNEANLATPATPAAVSLTDTTDSLNETTMAIKTTVQFSSGSQLPSQVITVVEPPISTTK